MSYKLFHRYSTNLGCFCPCCEPKEHTASLHAETCWDYSSGKELCTSTHFGGGDKCYYQC